MVPEAAAAAVVQEAEEAAVLEVCSQEQQEAIQRFGGGPAFRSRVSHLLVLHKDCEETVLSCSVDDGVRQCLEVMDRGLDDEFSEWMMLAGQADANGSFDAWMKWQVGTALRVMREQVSPTFKSSGGSGDGGGGGEEGAPGGGGLAEVGP